MLSYPKNFTYFAFTALILAVMAQSTYGFELSGSKWLGAETDFYINIPGTTGFGIPWNVAFITAMDQWSNNTRFTFNLKEEYRDPCSNDGFNGVDFAEDYCGNEFGANTLAITSSKFQRTLLGEPYIVESDIIVNGSEEFDIFGGALPLVGPLSNKFDFGRTALHELGHVIGLEHEDSTPAIMASRISDIDSLQPYDIAGV